MSHNLIIGNLYKRIELNENFSTTRFSSSREGILSIDNNIILFCTLEKSLKDKQFHYNDYFENDFFRWDSQNPQHINTPMIQKMVLGEVDIFLFCRIFDKIKGRSQPFVYCGLLEFSEHFENTSKPVHIIFESIEYQDNPNSNLKEIYDWRPKGKHVNPKRKSVSYKISKRKKSTDNKIGTYTIDHAQIRDRLLQKTNYTCQGSELRTGKCDVKLKDHPEWLYLYHINGRSSDNSPNNIKILCISCFQRQPLQQNFLVPARARNEIARRRKTLSSDLENNIPKKNQNSNENDLKALVQNYAVNRAIKVYQNSMYVVNEALSDHHYNLLCEKKGYQSRKILVKGDTGTGNIIKLYDNEVKSAIDKSSITDLFIVHSIIIQEEDNKFELKGGKIKHLQNWKPNQDSLTPIQYNYTVP